MVDYKKKTIPSQPAEKLDPNAVTRKELNGLAKKADLTGLAKRDELTKFVTKEELKSSNLTVDLTEFALKKNLKDLISKEYLRSSLDNLGLEHLATKCELKNLVDKRQLDSLVTKESLAKLVNPSMLSGFVNDRDLLAFVKKEELESFIKAEDAVRKKKDKQEITGRLDVKGALTVNGKSLKSVDYVERIPTRVIDSAPAIVGRADRNIIIKNTSNAIFGVKLPKGEKGHELVVKDGNGTSYLTSIVIEGFKSSEGKQELIDGQPKVFIRENCGAIKLVFDGKSWNIISK